VNGYTYNGKKMQIDAAEYVKTLSNPSNPNVLIDDLVAALFQFDLSAASKTQLKRDILLSGQITDSYWTDAWSVFINNPANTANTTTIKNKLRDLIKYLMNLAEYQLA
jgi:hypothetical protein